LVSEYIFYGLMVSIGGFYPLTDLGRDVSFGVFMLLTAVPSIPALLLAFWLRDERRDHSDVFSEDGRKRGASVRIQDTALDLGLPIGVLFIVYTLDYWAVSWILMYKTGIELGDFISNFPYGILSFILFALLPGVCAYLVIWLIQRRREAARAPQTAKRKVEIKPGTLKPAPTEGLPQKAGTRKSLSLDGLVWFFIAVGIFGGTFIILNALLNVVNDIVFDYSSTSLVILTLLGIIASAGITFIIIRQIQRSRVKKAEKGS